MWIHAPGLYSNDPDVRACLAPLLVPDTGREGKKAWVEGRLRQIQRIIRNTEKNLRRHKRRKTRYLWLALFARYKAACFINFLVDEGLIERGEFALPAYLSKEWPGEELSYKQMKKYLLVARNIPEKVVLARMAGITFLYLIAQTGGGACTLMLVGLLGSCDRAMIKAGAEAGKDAQAMKKSPEQVTRAAEEAMRRWQVIEQGGAAGALLEVEDLALEVERQRQALKQLLLKARELGAGEDQIKAAILKGSGGDQRSINRDAEKDDPDPEDSGPGGSGPGPGGPGGPGRSGPPGPARAPAAPAGARARKEEPVPAEETHEESQDSAEETHEGSQDSAEETHEESQDSAEEDDDQPDPDDSDDDSDDSDDESDGEPDGDSDDESDGDSDDESGGEAGDGPDEEEDLPAAQPPTDLAPYEEALAVPYPLDDDDPTQAERHACGLITALSQANDLVPLIRAKKYDWQNPVRPSLLLRIVDEIIEPFNATCRLMLPDLAEGARIGKAKLDPDLPQPEPLPPGALPPDECNTAPYTRAGLWSVPMGRCQDSPEFWPLAYLTIEVLDPLMPEDDKPNKVEGMLLRVGGLVDCAHRELRAFNDRFEHDAVSNTILFQMQQVLVETEVFLSMIEGSFRSRLDEARVVEAERFVAVEHQRLMAEQMAVYFGCDKTPRQFNKIGVTHDGRHAGITQSQPLVVIAVGPQGVGKTQGGVTLCEGLHLDLPGLNHMDQTSRSYTFSSSWRQGAVNRQHLRGLWPNPYLDQRRYLKETFRAKVAGSNAAYERLNAMCLPGTAKRYTNELPEECERGLKLIELGLGAAEWGAFGYRMIITGGTDSGGKGTAQWRDFIDKTIGKYGDKATPELIEQEFLKAKLRNVSEAAVVEQLRAMGRLTYRDGRQLIDTLEDPAPYVVLLEDAFLGPDMLVPLEVVMINRLSQKTKEDPQRWFFMHEMGKRGRDERLGTYMTEATGEVRHRPCSYYIETHQIGDLMPGVVALASGIIHYQATSILDYRKVQELCPGFVEVPYKVMRELPRGAAYAWFRQCTDAGLRRTAGGLWLRPSCIWAGGETVETGRGE